MTLDDTRIETGGVFRCCLESVERQCMDKDLLLEYKIKCKYCDEPFILLEKCGIPTWIPIWQAART